MRSLGLDRRSQTDGDDGQNPTSMQMKMFFTRLGDGSRMVIIGDRAQINLPRGVLSDLADAARLLKGIERISFNYFTAKGVVRHPLMAKIIEAYDKEAGGRASNNSLIGWYRHATRRVFRQVEP
jgi:phosphate starvation-inducible protein PhoH